MEKNIEVSLLLDFYGELLKPSGREATYLYYNDDLSLSEIAEETGITRQGVRDSIRRTERQLFGFEEKLGLLNAYRENRRLAEKAFSIIDSACMAEPYADKLKRLIEQITE